MPVHHGGLNVTIFYCSIQYIIIGLIITFLAACSGGGNGGTGFDNHPVVNASNSASMLEDETLSIAYSLPVVDSRSVLAAYPEYTSNVMDDIILALEKTHDPNCNCNYEILSQMNEGPLSQIR